MTNVETALLEKLQARSRENDLPDMCEDCDCDPDTCGRTVEDCEQEAAEEAAECRFDALREL